MPADKYLSWRTLPKGAMQEGETNGCGFFFLCEHQQRLAIPFVMSGQHKLWHLGKGTAQNALRGLIDCEQIPISFMGHKEASVLRLAENKRDKRQRRANAPAGGDEAAAADCTSQWQCLTCTLVQSVMNAQCEVCGCEPPSAAVCVDLWTCEVCTFENPLLMTTCEMCGAATSQLQLPQVCVCATWCFDSNYLHFARSLVTACTHPSPHSLYTQYWLPAGCERCLCVTHGVTLGLAE